MKYVSLDLETTGLNPKEDQILQVALVVEDTEHADIPVDELPHFVCYLRHPIIRGNAVALSMNSRILDILAGKVASNISVFDAWSDPAKSWTWVDEALVFLTNHFGSFGKINVAGKNVAGFDIPFLPTQLSSRFRHRTIDPGSVLIDWEMDSPPSLQELLKMKGIDKEVTHDALEDARDVIRLLRTDYGGNLK